MHIRMITSKMSYVVPILIVIVVNVGDMLLLLLLCQAPDLLYEFRDCLYTGLFHYHAQF